jgi:hypothetical protein
MPGQAGLIPVPAKLRPAPDGGRGKWHNGALHLAPGSIVWQPSHAGDAPAVELAAAMVLPLGNPNAGTTALRTPSGDFELEMPADMFMMTQELVAQATGSGQDQGWPS